MAEEAPIPVDKIDGRYEILRGLGGGLSGEVVLVSDGEGKKALKFLKKVQIGVSREEGLRNFKNEFAILKELNHPNIARILDFGFDPRSEKYYFTSEFIGGCELHTACEGQSFEVIEKLVVQVLRALNYLHARGIYHFDIKPQNVLVALEGGVPTAAKIIDFGLAGYVSPRKKVGTPAYMAPEVIAGGPLDGRTDLYSLGVLIYKVFTGVNPFASKSLKETMDNQVTLRPELPSKVNPKIPKYWDHAVGRLLEKNPAHRYSQAALVIRDLNLLSQKSFEVETKDTKLSYLPEKGTLIGREAEWRIFTRLFEDVFESDKEGTDRVLIVAGERGTGKSRILSEVKYFSQLKNVPVRSLRQLEAGDKPERFILLLDEGVGVHADRVNALLQELAKTTCLIVWAVEKAPRWGENAGLIELRNYDRNQLKLYLESVTGLSQAPARLIEEVYRRTLGNPLFVTEFVKSLLEQDLLYDASGKWDATTFEDIKIDFEKIRIPTSIEDCVLGQFKQLPEAAQGVLTWLAVHRRPLAMDELKRLVAVEELAAILLDLINRDVIEKTSREQHYYFRNVLYADVLYGSLENTKGAGLHDTLAALFEGDTVYLKEALYHRGHGTNATAAAKALLRLARMCEKERDDKGAIEALNDLRSLLTDSQAPEWLESQLLLGEVYAVSNQHVNAVVVFRNILAERQDLTLEKRFTVYDRLIDLHNKLEQLEESEAVIHRGLEESEVAGDKINRLVFRNYSGDILFKKGRIDEARTLLEETQKEWRETLSEAEQSRITNNRLGLVYMFQKEYALAEAVCKGNIDIFRKIGLKRKLAANLYVLADLYHRMLVEGQAGKGADLHEKCIENFAKSEALAREINDSQLILRIYNGLANAYSLQKQHDKVLDYFTRALVIARKIGEVMTAATISMNIGTTYKLLGKPHDSYTYLIYAINSFENIQNKSSHEWVYLWQAYVEISEVHANAGEFAKTRQMIEKARSIREDNPFLKGYEFWEHLELAKLHDKEGDGEKFEQELVRAKALATSALHQEEIAKITKKQPEKSQPLVTKGVKLMTDQTTPAGADHSHDLQTIIQINRFINAEHDTQQLLKTVLNYALQLTNAEAGFVLLLCDDGSFEVKAQINEKEEDVEKISMGVARLALETGEIVNSADALSDNRFDGCESVVLNELKSVLCLPIRSKNRSVGVFYLDNRYRVNAFTGCNVTLLNAFCDQVGIALETAKLIEELTAAQQQLKDDLAKTSEELAEVKGILKEESDTYKTRYAYQHIVTASRPMQEIFKLLDKVTETNLAVFFHGESGTGKELVAKALHYNNPTRAAKRFVAINCGAIPGNLMESEMFGYKAGSFTGANADKKGLFEEANGGTLFLDEIGELEPQLQVKLLRVLQEGEVHRVGDSRAIKVDVRVVSASHKDLQELVKQDKFREDLFYRLCQMKIDLPCLRDRKEDIPLLVNHFVEKFRKQNNIVSEINVPARFMRAMLEYAWPGNIRELENLISVAVALREGDQLLLEGLPPNFGIRQLSAVARSIQTNLADMSSGVLIDGHNRFDPGRSWSSYEALIIAKCYKAQGKKKIPTAELLKLSHSTLYKKVGEIGLDDDNHALYREAFVYQQPLTMKDYISKVFEASLKHHGNHPYAAIRQLGVSQGYFYKIMKTFKKGAEEAVTAPQADGTDGVEVT